MACRPVLAFQVVERKHAQARAAEEDAAPLRSPRGGKHRKNSVTTRRQKKPDAVVATDFAKAIANVFQRVIFLEHHEALWISRSPFLSVTRKEPPPTARLAINRW